MIMELPPYHKPKWGALMRYVFGRTKDTFFRIVKVVLLVCGVFWLLSYSSCSGCDGGGGCKGCMPDNAEANMGDIWEVCR